MIPLSYAIEYPRTMMIHPILALSTSGTMVNPGYLDHLALLTRFWLAEHLNSLLNLLHKHILLADLIIGGNRHIIGKLSHESKQIKRNECQIVLLRDQNSR